MNCIIMSSELHYNVYIFLDKVIMNVNFQSTVLLHAHI